MEAKSANFVDSNRKRVQHFMGVEAAFDHTSETQLLSLKKTVNRSFDTYNRCLASIAPGTAPADPRQFAVKLRGTMTDHASDQKCLSCGIFGWKQGADHDIRGEDCLLDMTPEDNWSIRSEQLKNLSKTLEA